MTLCDDYARHTGVTQVLVGIPILTQLNNLALTCNYFQINPA